MKKSKYIDHTLLKATATTLDIEKLCQEAIQYDFMSVCVNPANVSYAKKLLNKSNVLVCTVIGFPLGANSLEVKSFETKKAIEDGADEIDMVINVGALKSGNEELIFNEIKSVVKEAKGRTVKVIIETCYLTDAEKINVCRIAEEAGANFVKTSTGFGTGGATIEDVKLMRKTVSDKVKVKASGGIRNLKDFDLFISAGAERIGTSNGVSIMEDKKDDTNTTY